MPLYEYICETCETRFEVLRPMSRADESVSCPQGHGEAKRAISAFATVGASCAPTPSGFS